MYRFMMAAVLTTLFAATVLTATVMAAEQAKSPAEKYKALVAEFEEVGGARQFAEPFFQLADEHPQDPVAVDSLLWIVTNLKTRPEAKRALELLAKRHLDSEQLGPGCRQISHTPTIAAEQLLRACMERSPHRSVQAEACYYLAQLLEQQAEVVDQLKKQPELSERILEYYGQEYGAYLAALDTDALNTQIEQTCKQLKESFADVKVRDSTMGVFADLALFRIQHLSVGRVGPDIEGEDIDGKRFKLSDYRGKVVMLSFWGHWWGPCRELYPHERSLVEKHADQPFVLLGVNSDEDREELKNVIRKENLTWRSWWDGNLDGPIHEKWQVTARPSIFVVDQKGIIRFKSTSAEGLDAVIEGLLQQD